MHIIFKVFTVSRGYREFYGQEHIQGMLAVSVETRGTVIGYWLVFSDITLGRGFRYLTHTSSNCKNIEISCMDLKTSCATLNLHVPDISLYFELP